MTVNAELAALLKDHQARHSDFQMDYFITQRSGLTPYGCYKQALRELKLRYGVLRDLYISRIGLEAEKQIADEELSLCEHIKQPQTTLVRIKVEKCRASLEDNLDVIAETEREFLHFLGQAKALKLIVGELTPEKRRAYEREFWTEKFEADVEMELKERETGIQKGTQELIRASPILLKSEAAPYGLLARGDQNMFHTEPAAVTFDFEGYRGDLQRLLCG